MQNLDKKTLSILSLLMPIGVITLPLFTGGLFLIPTFMYVLGGYSFGILLSKE